MTDLYVTPTELTNSSSGINWSLLYAGGGGNLLAGQADLCQRVSTLVDNIVQGEVYGSAGLRQYQLRATQDTEVWNTEKRYRVRITAQGWVSFRPTYRPVLSVVSANWIPIFGAKATNPVPTPNQFDMTSFYVEGRDIVFAGMFAQFVDTTPLQVSVTYIDGYGNGLLTGTAPVAGATSLTVDNPLGFQPGEQVTIYDGGQTPPERVTLSSTYVAGTNPLQLASGTQYAHALGIRVSALPPDVQQAAIWIAMSLVQARAEMGVQSARKTLGADSVPLGATNYYKKAVDLLSRYQLTV